MRERGSRGCRKIAGGFRGRHWQKAEAAFSNKTGRLLAKVARRNDLGRGLRGSRLVNEKRGGLVQGWWNSRWQKFLPEDRHFAGGLDSQADFTPVNVNDRDADILTDLNLFSNFPTEYQHVATLLCATPCVLFQPILCQESRGTGRRLRRFSLT